MRETLALFAAKLPRGDRRRASGCDAGRAAVMGDATQIHQVLMNLVTNAAQAMPTGGTLRVALDARTRRRAARCHDGHARRAATTSCWMSPTPGAASRRRSSSGSSTPSSPRRRSASVPASACRSSTASSPGLGGAIDVATTVGKGSVFTVYLPRAGDVARVERRPRKRVQPETRRGGHGRVLIVDDEAVAGDARHGDADGARLHASRIHGQCRRARRVPRRSRAVRCGHHRREHAGHVRVRS